MTRRRSRPVSYVKKRGQKLEIRSGYGTTRTTSRKAVDRKRKEVNSPNG